MAFKMTGWSPFTKNSEVKVPGEDLVVDTETGEVIKKRFNVYQAPKPQAHPDHVRKEYIPQSRRTGEIKKKKKKVNKGYTPQSISRKEYNPQSRR